MPELLLKKIGINLFEYFTLKYYSSSRALIREIDKDDPTRVKYHDLFLVLGARSVKVELHT